MNVYKFFVWINTNLGAIRNDVLVAADTLHIAESKAARLFDACSSRYQLIIRSVPAY